ncbi:hypothetical protein [Herpetosiphon giganteus]|uniref:hypothetical protein n=1 Tax=Herpetosiphon giganteus TaxID=2029754 RepID=UPI001958D7D4|nr:hypothetical protein [Herpetosiphon giganteus]MBM7843562.1 hypothetical protein [Herpetosiphon giganteus]
MSNLIAFELFWLPEQFSGHSQPPFVRMQTRIRGESSQFPMRSIEWIQLEYTQTTSEGYALGKLLTRIPIALGQFKCGEQIKLLAGDTIIAVGKIVAQRATDR